MAEQITWSEAQEIALYRLGQKVELKRQPGKIDTVIAYDPYLVPPIVLASDPQPRYPEELTVITQPGMGFDLLKPWSRAMSGRKTAPDRQPLSILR
jgi:hypothetical protein